MIAEKRLVKLRLKKKSLSPLKCTDEAEISHDRLSDTFTEENCCSITPNETSKEIQV